jgi:hypothetical protein
MEVRSFGQGRRREEGALLAEGQACQGHVEAALQELGLWGRHRGDLWVVGLCLQRVHREVLGACLQVERQWVGLISEVQLEDLEVVGLQEVLSVVLLAVPPVVLLVVLLAVRPVVLLVVRLVVLSAVLLVDRPEVLLVAHPVVRLVVHPEVL